MKKYTIQELLGPVVLPLNRKQYNGNRYKGGFHDKMPDAIRSTKEKYKVTPTAATKLGIIDKHIRAKYLGSQTFTH